MIYMGYGYLAIAAMIFGNWDIGRTLAACLFFGLARSTGYQMILKLGMSSDAIIYEVSVEGTCVEATPYQP